MLTKSQPAVPFQTRQPRHVDAVVVGAGFAGLTMLHHLRELGLDAQVFEAGSDIGGTWYWNRYPGARTDSECYYYCYSFSEELLKAWRWSERYPGWEETQRYLNFVADRLALRDGIRFNTRVRSAIWDEDAQRWQVSTDRGDHISTRFFISGMGYISEPYTPPINGLNQFRGELHHTARWPKKAVDFQGKKVGIIGSGATAVQILPVVAEIADRVTLFQRTPNYVVPGRNRPMDAAWERSIHENYDEIWRKVRGHFFAMPFFGSPANRLAVDTPPEERERIYQQAWDGGGFRFFFETFDDHLVNPEAAEMAADFVRAKIREVVTDQDTAEKLIPRYPFFSKRPPLGHGYYEAFNRDNVQLVDILESEPIEEVVADGVRTGRGLYECDILILATGFDAITGAFTKVEIRGREDRELSEKWRERASTYLGMCTHGFPNLFAITGPLSPFANIPTIIEDNVKWIQQCIRYMMEHGCETAEAEAEAEAQWTRECNDAIAVTQLKHGKDVGSWFVGANIEGKPNNVLAYFGGADVYIAACDAAMARDFEGLEFQPRPAASARRDLAAARSVPVD